MSEIDLTYKENLVPRIRKLIKGYTMSSILKEYLQNADDAAATELIVSFDKRAHKTLNNTRFEEAKGPALLIENNSFFSEKDFESIIEISAGGKIDDASSTGRFGEGFSCSFSVSDDPSFISSGKGYWFDVLKHSVSKGQVSGKGVKAWDNLDSPEIQPWIKTFFVNSQSIIDANRTVFRLPLRTLSSAQDSMISSEIFTYENFLEWCRDWQSSAHNILFLRNIHRITLNEIKEDGTLVQHLSINTINCDEIEKINEFIQSDFKHFNNKSEAMCEHWLSTDKPLPVETYTHKLSIQTQTGKLVEKWAVVNGLFRGPDDILVKQALKALSIKPVAQKVLPWCGVAIKLDENDLPIKTQTSKIFTFLPLDMENPYPVLIHGWFDLDDKRTQLTLSGGGNAANILISWNKLLLQYGVAHAWAMLFDYVKGKTFLNDYFSYWPKRKSEPLNDSIVKGFYKAILEVDSLFILGSSQSGWAKPNASALIFRDQQEQSLLDVLERGYPLIKGHLTKDIQSFLQQAGLKLQELDAAKIAKDLGEKSINIDYPVKSSDLSVDLIESDEDLVIITNYLLNNGLEDFSDLPLSLAKDGMVYSHQQLMLTEPTSNLNLLQNQERFFLNEKITALFGDNSIIPKNWLSTTLQSVTNIINQYFDSFVLDIEWVKNIIEEIVNASATDRRSSTENIKKLKIGKCESGDWGTLNAAFRNYPPILIPNNEIKNYSIYHKLGINLYDRAALDTYQKLSSYEELIISISPLILVKYLIANDDLTFCQDEELRTFVLKQISADVSWIENLTHSEKQSFFKFPLLKTDKGFLRCIHTDTKLYVSSGFNAPENIQGLQSNYEVIVSVNDSENKLYKSLGFETLEPIKYLNEVVLPFINGHESYALVEDAIRWVVSEWKGISKTRDEPIFKELVKSIQGINIVPRDSDGLLLKPKELYHPDFFKTLPVFLQESSFKVKALFENDELNWLTFLSDIKLVNEFIPKHLISSADSIEQEEDVDRAVQFWNYVISQFDSLKKVHLGINILDSLVRTKTFPVETKKAPFNPSASQSKLNTSNKLVLKEDYSLLGIIYDSLHSGIDLDAITDKNQRSEIIERFRFIVKPSQNDVFINFRKLKEIETKSRKENREVIRFAKRFYRYIGRFKDIYLPNDLKIDSIRLGDMWVSPHNVFSRQLVISGTYCWSQLLEGENTEQLKEGLKKLGVSEEPDTQYLIDLLKRLPRNIKLDETQLSDAKAILQYFKDKYLEYGNNLSGVIPVLTTAEKLSNSSLVYIDDSPQYNNASSKNEDLVFAHKQYEPLASAAGAKHLTTRKGFFNQSKSITSTSIDKSYVKALFMYLASSSFKSALTRIYAHENDVGGSMPEFEIVPESVRFVDTLVIDYFIDNVWIYSVDTVTTFKDFDTLYILNQTDNDELWDSLAKYVCELSIISDSILVLRLIQKSRDLKAVHEFLDSKGITDFRELSEDEADAEFSIYAAPHEYVASSNSNDSENEDFEDLNIDDESKYDDEEHLSREKAVTSKKTISLAEAQKNITNKTFDGLTGIFGASTASSEPNKNGRREVLSLKNRKDNSSQSDIDKSIAPPIKPVNRLHESECSTGKTYERNSQLSVMSSSSSSEEKSIRNTSSNDRLPVYVGIDTENENSQSQKHRATEIGDKGEDYLIKNQKNYLSSPTNEFKKAPKNNMGYDILELTTEDEVVRYIEVKTLTGNWGDGGVNVTSPQYNFALENENWWLFVVEGIEISTPIIHPIKNPVLMINRYAFDSSWQQLSQIPLTEQNKRPEIGSLVKLPGNETIYTVIDIAAQSKIPLYKLESMDNEKHNIKKTYNAQWEML